MLAPSRIWSISEILDLRTMLSRKAPLTEIAHALRREVEEVRAKAITLGLWAKTIPIGDARKSKTAIRA